MARVKPRRRRGKVVYRAVVREEAEGVLQVGSPSPSGRAVSPGQIRELMEAALKTWPDTDWFTVAVFARWEWDEPRPEGGYVGFGQAKQEESYGHQLGGVSRGRHYYGWRSKTPQRAFLAQLPVAYVVGILEEYGGRKPIRCVTVRPW